jgi:DNA-binding HxlR family transcriptional regulator
MKHDELQDLYCSVARTWSVIGERWTMMILRECFRGQRRYDHFRSKLGLGSNVLNDRLRVLVDE